jgi:hypothetical protein
VTNASAKKRELFYHGVGSPTSQLVVDFELQGADALAELLSRRFAPVKILPFTNAGRFSRCFREAYGVSPFAVARKGPQR